MEQCPSSSPLFWRECRLRSSIAHSVCEGPDQRRQIKVLEQHRVVYFNEEPLFISKRSPEIFHNFLHSGVSWTVNSSRGITILQTVFEGTDVLGWHLAVLKIFWKIFRACFCPLMDTNCVVSSLYKWAKVEAPLYLLLKWGEFQIISLNLQH